MADSITLNGIALSGPTQKVALSLALAGKKFSYRHVNLGEGEHKKPEFLALNRYGQVPVLQDGSQPLCQSGAILFHLADKYGVLAGKDEKTKIQAKEWVLWDMDALSPPIFRCRAAARGMFKPEPDVLTFLQRQAGSALKQLDGFLEGKTFLTGDDPTIGDIACYVPCFMAGEGNITLENRPNVQGWMKRIEALPGFKPPYELLPMNDAEIG